MTNSEARKIFLAAREMWGIDGAWDRIGELARECGLTDSPVIAPMDAAALLVADGWALGDFLRRFS